jgi:hypothetical protein
MPDAGYLEVKPDGERAFSNHFQTPDIRLRRMPLCTPQLLNNLTGIITEPWFM